LRIRFRRWGLYSAAIFSSAVLGFPIYWMFNTSISPRDELYVYPPTFIHPHPTAAAYLNIISSRPIGQWLGNSTLIVGATLLPATTLIIPLFILMRSLGLIDNLLSLVLADSTVVIPFAVWMLKGYFDSIPRELEEAALVDGTGYLGALFRITVPLAAPGIVA